MADYLPIVSQLKSAIQAICGDTKGARKTQDNFTKSFPLISQFRAARELYKGEKGAAMDTFMGGITIIDGIPVVGHLKGVVHYACGDKEGGDAAMISSSRTTGVIVASVGGFLVGGPPGAAAAGLAGGALMDSVTTAVDSAVHGKTRPHGTFYVVGQICNNPKDPWNYVDLVAVPAIDAAAGYMTGKGIAKAKPGATPRKALKTVVQDLETASNIAKNATAIEDRATRCIRQMHSPHNDELETNVLAVVGERLFV